MLLLNRFVNLVKPHVAPMWPKRNLPCDGFRCHLSVSDRTSRCWLATVSATWCLPRSTLCSLWCLAVSGGPTYRDLVHFWRSKGDGWWDKTNQRDPHRHQTIQKKFHTSDASASFSRLRVPVPDICVFLRAFINEVLISGVEGTSGPFRSLSYFR